jgi:hypothetical protein
MNLPTDQRCTPEELPVCLFSGYFVTHTVQALVQTAAYVGNFYDLRSLAAHREGNNA